MKKSILLLLLFAVATATVFTSYKKDKTKTEKERVAELLTSGKWYCKTFKNSSSTKVCFEPENYWEFKANGSFEEHWDWGNGTYTVSADGKAITLTKPNGENYTISDISIDNSTFSFKLSRPGYYV